MIPIPSGVRVWLATGRTDMRRYAECMIMRSPQQRLACRCGFARVSLRIILGPMAIPQHSDELVRGPEPARF